MPEDNTPYSHLPVMSAEVMEWLRPLPGETAVDGTVGLGGHSRLVAEVLGGGGRLVCFDRDPEALARARENLADLACRVDFVNQPYSAMARELPRLGLTGVRRILLDLGVSSLQLDKPDRGFSFRRDGPLDMRMNQAAGRPARDIVNLWPEERLAVLFRELGEERHSGRIAKKIAEARRNKPIETTGELSSLVEECLPARGRIHPATKIFQALRMEVNDELGELSRGLAAAGRVLEPGGRLAVITFHSLEDRLVKRTFLKWADLGLVRPARSGAIVCGREEAVRNRRARSAKLRVVERTGP